ncbi:radical SAM family heme chaperone HemW [Endozoicomonas euniceicola]|uniref:Heme chaperone HemW n=1 Tax=Endozoicomonas euniceicola TaxID=1234143 RepID=A0ABY6GYX4_9GAMM|nr:radical SAM family heme chaperone HemW [Endozoicomonas euniceicola]UYM17999.1 radical SAM family heme chaperone HemW [Endozoicomonas euniceicola]
MLQLPPLSLYVHIPWCVKKCPYCDFNSHALKGGLPEQAYVDALLQDFDQELEAIQGRPLRSLFIGGGTPSLMSAEGFDRLLQGLQQRIVFADDIEITMEANPGTYEHDRFKRYRDVGINRLSLGVQSFQDEKLKALGRIHCAAEAREAIASLQAIGFDNFNIDLMHGLPGQTTEDALFDLKTAIDLKPTHLSWYQLTIEPNTIFYSKTPVLPEDDELWSIQEQGWELLEQGGFEQYEISAYSQPGRQARHNLNYWQFGDYIGIGAGAHGKLTDYDTGNIYRNWKTRMPAHYMNTEKSFEAGRRVLEADELPIEFMMNALRLNAGVPEQLFTEHTGMNLEVLAEQRNFAIKQGLLENSDRLQPTRQGRLFLNNLLEIFA